MTKPRREGISVVVLAKHSDHAKSRLRLPPESARHTALLLAAMTIRTARSAKSVGVVLVVTSDHAIAADALLAGADVVMEGRPLGMNRAAALGRRHALELSPSLGVAILVADLPYLRSADIDAAVEEYIEGGDPLFVADRHGSGTTCLIHGPESMPRFAFGRRSAQRHRRLGYREAQRPGRGLRADLDTPDDLWEAGLFNSRRLMTSPHSAVVHASGPAIHHDRNTDSIALDGEVVSVNGHRTAGAEVLRRNRLEL